MALNNFKCSHLMQLHFIKSWLVGSLALYFKGLNFQQAMVTLSKT